MSSRTVDARPQPAPPGVLGAIRRGGLPGLLAGALALGSAELAAGGLARAVSPAIVVGGAAIDRTPRFLKEFAIRTFGENDKIVLLAGIFTTVGLLAVLIGGLTVLHRRTGLVAVSLLGLIAAAAAATRPSARWSDVLPSLLAAVVGVVALAVLLPATPRAATTGRRGVLAAAGAAALTLGVAVAAGVGGRALLGARTDVQASRRRVRLPAPVEPAPPVPAGADLTVPQISPLFTANRDFYRVDTALSVPRLTAEAWRLRVHGMVERELTLNFDELLARPVVERDITLTCVSNEVGGPLLGAARWLGVELAPLLAEAGVRPGADQLVSTSSDGMTIGTPVAAVTDGRDAILAFGMNGEPLPPEHGFPVRMVVPGLYGYVSATKWLVDLELSTFAAFDAYWVRREWAPTAPILTSSRIDTPRPLSTTKAGRIAVAGVAWAQHRGVSAVEVRVDGGAWQQAELAQSVSKDMWRQWVWQWDAEPGSHTLQVRATDGTGAVQVEERATPFPRGSTGRHSVVVIVA